MPMLRGVHASKPAPRMRCANDRSRLRYACRLTVHIGGICMNHLRFLHYVDEVARVGSVRQAAERLHVAASAVNRRVQDIEDELGTPIFERLPRGMRLTAAGELFVRYIRSRAAD